MHDRQHTPWCCCLRCLGLRKARMMTNIDVPEACFGWFSFLTTREVRTAAEDNVCQEQKG